MTVVRMPFAKAANRGCRFSLPVRSSRSTSFDEVEPLDLPLLIADLVPARPRVVQLWPVVVAFRVVVRLEDTIAFVHGWGKSSKRRDRRDGGLSGAGTGGGIALSSRLELSRSEARGSSILWCCGSLVGASSSPRWAG